MTFTGPIWQDVCHGCRSLARSPGFTAVVTAMLAITLGANTALFSVMNGVLLRALPYPDPERIVDVSLLTPATSERPGRKEFLDSRILEALQQEAKTLEAAAAYSVRSFTLSGSEAPERLAGANVSTTLFPLLGISPAKGRTFRDEEGQAGADRVVLLSHGLWKRRFGAAPTIVGKTVVLEGVPYTVVGVMPEGFLFPNREIQLWTPLTAEAPASPAGSTLATRYDPTVARLGKGVSLARAQTELQAIAQRVAAAGSTAEENPGRVQLVPLRDAMAAEVRPTLLAMSAAVGLVLVIACVNLASLLLARGLWKQREMAIRSALGGSRGRLIRQALIESTLLSLMGGIAGLLLAAWIHRLLPTLVPQDIPRLEEVRLDLRVFLFAMFLSGLTGLICGLLPAIRSAGPDLARALHGGGGGESPGWSSRNVFVVVEVALTFVVLVGAGLLLRSYLNLMAVEPGYEPDCVLTATLDLGSVGPDEAGRAAAFFDALLASLEQQPAVEAVGVVSFPPLTQGFSMTSVTVSGEPAARTLAVTQGTSPGYLRALGLRIAEGRWMTTLDHESRAPVAVVNETFVRRFIARPQPLGRRVEVGGVSVEIVGVIEDVRLLGLDSDPKPEILTSYHLSEAISGTSPQRLTLAIRSTGDSRRLVPLLRKVVYELEPALAVNVTTMEASLAESLAQPRFYALLLGIFAAVALVLASAGIYGVVAESVARRTRAIGIRRALGAEPRDILALVFRKAFVAALQK